ncbi:MAG: hypothetical protein AAF291_10475 [Pseudomonadota bacterium]
MSASPSASSQRSSSPTPAPRKAEPVREASKPTPRNQAEARSARERFAARLDNNADRSSGASGSEKASSSPTSERARVEANGERGREGQSGSGGEQGNDDRGGSTPDNFAANGLSGLALQATSGMAHPTLTGPAIIDPAMLERMAAQIAENWPTALLSSGPQSASVAFPAGAIAQGAQITRGSDGALAVLITGLDPRFSAVQHARLQAQLTGMLARQRLKVKSVRLETADQRGRRIEAGPGDALAIPRVV